MNMIYFLADLTKQIDPNELGIPKVDPNAMLKNGLGLFYFLVGAVAIVMVVLSGISIAASSGDAEKIKKAKNTITYSVIGLVLVALAFVITSFLTGVFK